MSFISEGIEKELRELRERLDSMEPGDKRSHVIGDFLSVLNHCLEEIEMNKMKIQTTILEWESLLIEEEAESEDFDFAEAEEVSEEKSEWE